MSNYFSVSISVDYLIIMHRENMGFVYFRGAPGVEFKPKFMEDLRRAIQFEELELPQAEGDISQGTVAGKYIIMRSGKNSITILVINQKPNRFTREALHSFAIRLESRWGRELKGLFTDELAADIDVFHKDTETRQSVDKLVDEIFHLEFTLPHKLGLPTVELKGAHRKLWELAEELARGQGYVLLGDLLASAQEKMGRNKDMAADLIFEFVSRGFMTAIPLQEFVQRYSK
jgi:hypothetical protein